MDRCDETGHRSSLFENGNKVRFQRPINEVARAWWIEAFLEPHGLTPEGMGELLTKSQAASKSILYHEIDGAAHTFSLRVDGSLGTDAGIWLVERSLHLDGSDFNAERMFVSPAGDRAGIGRNLMHDLIEASDILGITRITLEAERIGRYAWLRMGFVPDRSSWRNIQVEAARFIRRHAVALGPKADALYDAVVQGDPRTARWFATIGDPIESRDIFDDFGEPGKVPFGRAFFLEASPNWAGSFDFDPESRRIARDYVGGRERMTDQKKPPSRATSNWGSLANDPWWDPFPATPAWEEAVRRTFLRDGGTPEQYAEIFGTPATRNAWRRGRDSNPR